jgi:hypothetical protein
MEWRYHWGNSLVTHRTPANWRKYGEETGRLLAENEWDEFVFYRSSDTLAVMPKAVDKKVEWAVAEFTNLRLYGREMHVQYGDEGSASPTERKIWSTAFREAYEEVVESRVDELIPPKLRKNLDLFCDFLGHMRRIMDGGDGRETQFGIELSGKKKVDPWTVYEPPPKGTYKPTRKEMLDLISDSAKASIDVLWKKYMARRSDGHSFRNALSNFNKYFPRDWDVSELELTENAYLYAEAVKRELGGKALELAPASAWKNSYLICSLYDLILAQEKRVKKEYVPTGESRPRKGFWLKKDRKDYAEESERQEWEAKTRIEIESGFEKQAKRLEKQKKQKPTMGGEVTMRPQALVIVHLSSLDSYTDYAGVEGEQLASRLTLAILEHQGPVIIVDQGWELGPRPSRPRAQLLREIAPRQDIVWIRFEEAEESWDDFFPKLYAALDDVDAGSAVIGGVWHDPSLHTGCATFVYLNLRQRMPATVDEDLVGCE